MFRSVKVLGGVLVLGRIATADVPAFETQTQVDPGIPHLETFFAALATRSDLLDFFLMTTRFRHKLSFTDARIVSTSLSLQGFRREELGAGFKSWENAEVNASHDAKRSPSTRFPG
jgi:hypothetical protein